MENTQDFKQEKRFPTYLLEDFARAFVTQNRRIKERRDSGVGKLMTARGLWEEVLGLDSEQELTLVFEQSLENPTIADKIIEALAKAMYHDETDWEATVKNYWFLPALFKPLKQKVGYRLRKIREKHLEENAAIEVGKHFDGVTVGEENGKFIITFPDLKEGEEMPVQASFPARLKNCIGLLDRKKATDSTESRTSVAYRVRTDVGEIIELAAAATNQSKTEFVEDLVLNFANIAVRSACSASLRDGASLHYTVGRNLYEIMHDRYDNDVNKGHFPLSKDEDINPTTKQGLGWLPYMERPVGSLNKSYEETIDQLSYWLNENAKSIDRLNQSSSDLSGLLRNVVRFGAEGWNEFKNEQKQELEEMQGILKSEQSAE